MSTDEKNSKLGDHYLSQKRLVFEIAITANATPASKVHFVEGIPGVVLLRTEGKTADADAVEDLSGDFTTAVDLTNAQFGVLIKGDETDEIEKVYKVTVTEQTATGTSITVASATADYLTSGGNIAIDILATGTSLATESPTFLIEVEYRKAL